MSWTLSAHDNNPAWGSLGRNASGSKAVINKQKLVGKGAAIILSISGFNLRLRRKVEF